MDSQQGEHDPLTCEICHAEGTGAEIDALTKEVERLREAANGLLRMIDGKVSPSDAKTDIAFAREAAALQQERRCSMDAFCVRPDGHEGQHAQHREADEMGRERPC